MAVPRLALPNGGRDGGGTDGVVMLPHPLEAGTAARIRHIFTLQRQGEIPAAIIETAHLDDNILLGDLLADRYLGPDAKPLPSQLHLWLKTFSDLPDAPAISRLLAGVSTHGTRPVPVPATATLGAGLPAAPGEADPAIHPFRRNQALDYSIQARLGDGPDGAANALKLIAANRHLDPLYASQLHAEVALRLFTEGEDDLALQVGQAAFAVSGGRIGLAGYVAGLAAWRGGELDAAEALFEASSRADLTPASVRAGAAFWAARTHLRFGDVAVYRPWLERAAAAPRTFYGMLALRLLGRQDGTADRPAAPTMRLVSLSGTAGPSGDDAAETSNTDDSTRAGLATLSEIDVDAVAATAAGRRAFALLQVGETERAEASLRHLWPTVQTDLALCRSIQLVSEAAGLSSLSTQLADILQNRDGQPQDQAHFPMPRLSPHHGFTMNPALVYALTRLESNFDPGAVSDGGAHGLMQLLPTTAGFVVGHPDRFTDSAIALHDPALNLELGQRYLTYLSDQVGVDGDLVKLFASYNAGPGAVLRWEGLINGSDDPLLFIESLPSDETRDYVRRAFTYLWIYSRRLDLPSPSLASLAAGEWPKFADEQALRPVSLH
ncbi:MAG: lytic transglycosylase domain-containing protein [Janthinobacterium lividum]